MTVATRPIPTIPPDIEAQLLREHPGEWAAFGETGELVAVGASSVAVYDEARRAGVETPTLYHVPEPGDKNFYY